jgi:prepilin-type N-terminal cleavage/methylation domain-containing protein
MYKMKRNKGFIARAGFTLVELLVVISIIGVLASIGLVAFNSAQGRSRDAQRKSDLKQISSALELFYSDYGRYPSSNGSGQILGCPSTTSSSCVWGTSEFTDGQTTYFRVLPEDKTSGKFYFYRTVAVGSVANSGFQIYARLENSQDSSIIVTDADCGTGLDCNFAVTSPNTVP